MRVLSCGSLNQPRQAVSTLGLISTAVERIRSTLEQNLVREPAPRPSCIACRRVTEPGSTKSSQAIMRWMY